jgi:hypothetical protein
MGSQSFPNNEGIRVSRGDWIAYIGHDDIWTGDHLSRIHATSLRDRDADFVVSGCVYHTPPGTGIYYINGLFEKPDNAVGYFFPPSSIAHRREVTERIGSWQDPRSIAKPVDHDFTQRAIKAGMRFISTGAVTTHKFAAGHRYLSYLRVNSDEQQDMLGALINGTAPDPAQIVETAKRAGTYMLQDSTDYEKAYKPGHVFETNRQNKGLSRPPLSPLHQRTVIRQTPEGRALDWQNFKRRWPKNSAGPAQIQDQKFSFPIPASRLASRWKRSILICPICRSTSKTSASHFAYGEAGSAHCSSLRKSL